MVIFSNKVQILGLNNFFCQSFKFVISSFFVNSFWKIVLIMGIKYFKKMNLLRFYFFLFYFYFKPFFFKLYLFGFLVFLSNIYDLNFFKMLYVFRSSFIFYNLQRFQISSEYFLFTTTKILVKLMLLTSYFYSTNENSGNLFEFNFAELLLKSCFLFSDEPIKFEVSWSLNALFNITCMWFSRIYIYFYQQMDVGKAILLKPFGNQLLKVFLIFVVDLVFMNLKKQLVWLFSKSFRRLLPFNLFINFFCSSTLKVTAALLGRDISFRLKKHHPMRLVIKDVFWLLKRKEVLKYLQGIVISLRGRFIRSTRASFLIFRFGNVNFSTFTSNIDYYENKILLRYGISMLRIWCVV